MATTYTSTFKLRCVKEHTCAGCGSIYRYPMNRTVKATSRGSAEDATRKCRAKVDVTAKRDVDPHPCPACGLLQPDMVGRRRARGHKWVVWLFALTAATVLIVRAADGLNAGPATWALTAVTAAAALAFAAVEGLDPNRNVDANRQTAADEVAAGTVTLGPQKRPVARTMMRTDVPGRAGPRWPLVGLVLLMPLLAAAPEVVRSTRRWPANDNCYPPVVGPGDTTRVYMRQKIGSIKGYYRGTAEAMLTAAGGGPVPLNATTNQNDWGSTIHDVKESEKQTFHQPWVSVTLPPDPGLAGKAATCAVHLSVEYPAIAPGETNFQTERTTMDDQFPLRLAPPRAGAAYQSLWWTASGVATAVLLAGGFLLLWLANRLRTPGTTTGVAPAAA